MLRPPRIDQGEGHSSRSDPLEPSPADAVDCAVPSQTRRSLGLRRCRRQIDALAGEDAVRTAYRASGSRRRCACSASRPCSAVRLRPTGCRPASPRTSRAAPRRCQRLRRCEAMSCASRRSAPAFGVAVAIRCFFVSSAFGCILGSFLDSATLPGLLCLGLPPLSLRPPSPWRCGDPRCACVPRPQPSCAAAACGPARARPITAFPRLLSLLGLGQSLGPLGPGQRPRRFLASVASFGLAACPFVPPGFFSFGLGRFSAFSLPSSAFLGFWRPSWPARPWQLPPSLSSSAFLASAAFLAWLGLGRLPPSSGSSPFRLAGGLFGLLGLGRFCLPDVLSLFGFSSLLGLGRVLGACLFASRASW